MTSKVFFDTNVLLYAFARKAGSPLDLRTDKAEEIMGHGGVLSVQVLNEFSDVASRKSKLSWEEIAELLRIVEALCGRALPITAEIHEAAVDISKLHGFRIYDSLILAAAVQAGCTTVYTEDLQHGQVINGVRIENPFLGTSISGA
jgi:predicted nucleic acid-binding protein